MEYEIEFEDEKNAKLFFDNAKENVFDYSTIKGSIIRLDSIKSEQNPRRNINFDNYLVYINPIIKLQNNGKYLNFWNNDYLSDLELIVGKQVYKVHRVILANASEFFDRLFKSSFREKGQGRITIEADNNFFPLVLKVLYGGRVVLAPTSDSLKFLQIIDYFGIKLDINKFISNIDIPEPEDFLSYLEEIQIIYHDENDIPQSVIDTLRYYLETYYESQNEDFFDSIRELLPIKLQN